jgi:hypothetical protein
MRLHRHIRQVYIHGKARHVPYKKIDRGEVDNWRERLAALDDIDWSKKNPDWENVCIIANSVVSNRQARAATKAYIKAKLSMELTESEQRSLEKKAA